MIKVGKGLLIADRVIAHTISWESVNSTGWIEGIPTVLYNTEGIIRSLTGGCAYADENENLSLTDKDFGAFPTNNEWDKYIVNFPQELIQEGKTLDDVFHFDRGIDPNMPNTWCQDTPVNGFLRATDNLSANSSHRISRVKLPSLPSGVNMAISSHSSSAFGFRPVFQYKDY